LVLDGWFLGEASVAVGVLLDGPFDAGEAAVNDVVKDDVLVPCVVVVSDIVRTDVAVHISGQL
jgi:hypothetical protein